MAGLVFISIALKPLQEVPSSEISEMVRATILISILTRCLHTIPNSIAFDKKF